LTVDILIQVLSQEEKFENQMCSKIDSYSLTAIRTTLLLILFIPYFSQPAYAYDVQVGQTNRIESEYQYSCLPGAITDTSDINLPLHKYKLKAIKTLSSKTSVLIRYEFRQFEFNETSYRRYLEPKKLVNENLYKLGINHQIHPNSKFFSLYQLVTRPESYKGQSIINGIGFSITEKTYIEPTYAFFWNSDKNPDTENMKGHTVMFRVRQILTPIMYLMAKNTFYVALGETTKTQFNTVDAFIGTFFRSRTILHVGYRNYTNMDNLISHTIWASVSQYCPWNVAVILRYRHYVVFEELKEEEKTDKMASDMYTLRIERTPLCNFSIFKYTTFYLSYRLYNRNDGVKADSYLTGLSYLW